MADELKVLTLETRVGERRITERRTGIPTEFMLRHDALSKKPNKSDNESANLPTFRDDVTSGALSVYAGTFVAYHKGILCGQSADGKKLYDKTTYYYGSSNLAVFKVPKCTETVDDTLKDAIGQW